ncbi:unnamed protein product [Sphagnum troendelagicum]|uniref:Uncharacterized protein n=1 Tax=Sphagnum troendelagicum TaxID=128251 RepID=A0ABP0UV64_9BRYO
MSLTIPHSQTHRESSLVLGIPDIHPTPVMIIEDIDRPLLDHHHPLRSTSLARPSSPAEPALCSFHKVGAGLHIMAWSEDDVVKSGSITIVDITAKGEVAPPVLVEINDEEAQLERIKKVIEVVNKSEYLHGAFEEAMLELLETYLKLLNSPQHRWSSTALVLERILIAWELFLQAYRKLNRPVPLIDMDRTLCIKFYSMIESIRAVQIKAQVMQTFIIVDVYIMLYSLYTIVLDVSKPLKLIIPVCRQLGSENPDPVSQSHDVLQSTTRETRKLLGKTMSKCYFKRYHPILAFRQPKKIYDNNLGRPMLLKNVLEETNFKFLYLIDAQSMLYLPMTFGKILAKLINATNIDRLDIHVGWTQESLQKQHFVFVNQFIWNKIKCLAETLQRRLCSRNSKWQGAILAILANKPSLSGLECDLGSLSDVLAPKRSSLRADLVEINMFLKINKHLIPTNPAEVAPFDKKMNWENNIPKRPVMALYDGGEEEEKEEEDIDDDNDNSPI